MYSFFDYENIEVKDYKGLKRFLERWESYLKKHRKGEGWERIMRKKVMLNEKNKTLSFESWDDIKLISYWYDIEVIFLNCIAKYIDGNVNWTFENLDEGGYVNFEDGVCEFNVGVMEWNRIKGLGIMSKKAKEELCPELKKMIILSSL